MDHSILLKKESPYLKDSSSIPPPPFFVVVVVDILQTGHKIFSKQRILI